MSESESDADTAYLAARARIELLNRRLRWIIIFAGGTACALLARFAYLVVRFPFASVPAMVGTAIGYQRTDAERLRRHRPIETMTLSEQGGAFLWALGAGSLGYTVFAAVGLGVPAPEAALLWRLIGGAVFGAAAGVAAWLAVGLAAAFAPLMRSWRV